MNSSHLAISCALVLLTVSCHGKEEESVVLPPQYRISCIQSENSTQTFEYNAAGQVTEMGKTLSSPGSSFQDKSSYLYPEEGNIIAIVSEETSVYEDVWHSEEIKHFEEKLFLSQNGIAEHAIGNVVIRQDDRITMMKNYTVEFHYNSSQQLTKIDIAEKRTNETGWEETNALKWTVDLEWTDGNLTKYSGYTNPEHPMVAISYSYFGGSVIDYTPVLQPILRHFYLPLQYQGIFGAQAVDLLKEKEVINSGETKGHVYKYSYDLGTSIYDSKVEGYTEYGPNEESEYSVSWAKK